MTLGGQPSQSFVPVSPESHFPIQNLPYGVFRAADRPAARVGVAIGEQILDLAVLEERGLLRTASSEPVFARSSLNGLMALGRPAWREVRARVTQLLAADEPTLRDDAALRSEALVPMGQAELLLPVEIGDYTDFYSSRDHATNVGVMFRGPDQPLLPNWLHLPVAYHGRSSSVVVSGTDLHRPLGQTKGDADPAPTFGPSRAVDFELEMGLFIGVGNPLGQPVPIQEAAEHVLGMVLVNDWSARDIQRWEYVPLGPFLSKNFGTSISPWVVTLDALEPFRTPGPPQDPTPLEYLRSSGDWAFDIQLEVALQPAGQSSTTVCRSNFRHLYWNICQQIAHHTINGCNLRPGDLLASGTISGPSPEARGCLLELTWGGREPVQLADGATRRFLEDGDRVTMSGWCQGPGYRVGFGEVTGQLLPAIGSRPA
jgi:fumarylacetoacetase